MGSVYIGFFEVHVLGAFAIVVEAVEDGREIRLVHQVEQESLSEVVPGRPK